MERDATTATCLKAGCEELPRCPFSQPGFSLVAIVDLARAARRREELPRCLFSQASAWLRSLTSPARCDDRNLPKGRLQKARCLFSQPGFSLVAVVDLARAARRLQPA
ncbi:MAG TPA: hypothetical protein VFI01_08025 [Gaiellaceae bacterium]|nr:hypothetical protein [Gaiellaceae bacterium]